MHGVHVHYQVINHFVTEVMLKRIRNQPYLKQKRQKMPIYVVVKNLQMPHIVMVHI